MVYQDLLKKIYLFQQSKWWKLSLALQLGGGGYSRVSLSYFEYTEIYP